MCVCVCVHASVCVSVFFGVFLLCVCVCVHVSSCMWLVPFAGCGKTAGGMGCVDLLCVCVCMRACACIPAHVFCTLVSRQFK